MAVTLGRTLHRRKHAQAQKPQEVPPCMGAIVAAALAPHPPHLVYAENPDRNEPNAEGGWEQLRWGYERLERPGAHRLRHHRHPLPTLADHTWTHVLQSPSSSLSVDPIFPNLFRYQYDLEVDVGLAKSIHKAGVDAGLTMQMMENPDFRVDYGTITSCHLIDPEWSKPIVALSSNRGRHYYSVEVMQEMMIELGRATRTAIEASIEGPLIASNSFPRHFTSESRFEDMSREHITSHAMHLWTCG